MRSKEKVYAVEARVAVELDGVVYVRATSKRQAERYTKTHLSEIGELILKNDSSQMGVCIDGVELTEGDAYDLDATKENE